MQRTPSEYGWTQPRPSVSVRLLSVQNDSLLSLLPPDVIEARMTSWITALSPAPGRKRARDTPREEEMERERQEQNKSVGKRESDLLCIDHSVLTAAHPSRRRLCCFYYIMWGSAAADSHQELCSKGNKHSGFKQI